MSSKVHNMVEMAESQDKGGDKVETSKKNLDEESV